MRGNWEGANHKLLEEFVSIFGFYRTLSSVSLLVVTKALSTGEASDKLWSIRSTLQDIRPDRLAIFTEVWFLFFARKLCRSCSSQSIPCFTEEAV